MRETPNQTDLTRQTSTVTSVITANSENRTALSAKQPQDGTFQWPSYLTIVTCVTGSMWLVGGLGPILIWGCFVPCLLYMWLPRDVQTYLRETLNYHIEIYQESGWKGSIRDLCGCPHTRRYYAARAASSGGPSSWDTFADVTNAQEDAPASRSETLLEDHVETPSSETMTPVLTNAPSRRRGQSGWSTGIPEGDEDAAFDPYLEGDDSLSQISTEPSVLSESFGPFSQPFRPSQRQSRTFPTNAEQGSTTQRQSQRFSRRSSPFVRTLSSRPSTRLRPPYRGQAGSTAAPPQASTTTYKSSLLANPSTPVITNARRR